MTTRSVSLAIRVTAEEFLRIRKCSKRAHKSMTAFIVEACLGKPTPPAQPVKFTRR